MNDRNPPEEHDLPVDAKFHWSEGLKYVSEGLKALFILNGAATISVLTFIGNENSGDDRLVYSMFCFAAAALLGPVAFMAAYLTQLQYGNGDHDRAWTFHKFTYICVLLSLVLFVAGVIVAGMAFLDFTPDIGAGN